MVNPEMVRIEGGTFIMGSDSGQEDETPRHTIELKPYYLARNAVTNREYKAFLAATGASPPPFWQKPPFDQPAQPVVAVNWFEAIAYCDWLSRDLQLRLPTEAEREYACRGGAATEYPWGNQPENPLRLSTQYGVRWAEGPEVVGGSPNGFGLCNMADNVHEWCSDWYAAGYYRISPRKDPHGPESGIRRVARGGSWRHHIKVSRCSARSSLDPGFKYSDFGFRVASGPEA